MRIFILFWGIEYEERLENGCFRTLSDAKKAAEILKSQVGTEGCEWKETPHKDLAAAWSTGHEFIEIQECQLGSFKQWKALNDKQQEQARRKAAEDEARWKAGVQAPSSSDSNSSDLSPEPHDLC